MGAWAVLANGYGDRGHGDQRGPEPWAVAHIVVTCSAGAHTERLTVAEVVGCLGLYAELWGRWVKGVRGSKGMNPAVSGVATVPLWRVPALPALLSLSLLLAPSRETSASLWPFKGPVA